MKSRLILIATCKYIAVQCAIHFPLLVNIGGEDIIKIDDHFINSEKKKKKARDPLLVFFS